MSVFSMTYATSGVKRFYSPWFLFARKKCKLRKIFSSNGQELETAVREEGRQGSIRGESGRLEGG
jgi:hypothetical protein